MRFESESLARLAATVADEAGRKVVYSSARMVVRLEPTPAYKPPVSDALVRVEDGAPEGVVVAHHVPRYLSWGYAIGSDDHTKEGHTVTEVTMQHTQYEHRLIERVEALTAKMADFATLYHELKAQGLQVAENLAANEDQVNVGKQKEGDLSTERSNLLNERDELKEKLQASDQAKLRAQCAEGVALQNMALETQAFEKRLLEAAKEAQHCQNQLVRVGAEANTICVELADVKSRLGDIGGKIVYLCNRQQCEENLETRLQEARDELAEMTQTMDEAKGYLKEATAKAGNEMELLEARVEELDGENAQLAVRVEKSEQATRAAMSSGSAHADVWDQSPSTKEAQLMAIKEAGEPLLRAFEADLKEAKRMAVARKRRGLSSITLADMVGLLASCNARVKVMMEDAARRRVSQVCSVILASP